MGGSGCRWGVCGALELIDRVVQGMEGVGLVCWVNMLASLNAYVLVVISVPRLGRPGIPNFYIQHDFSYTFLFHNANSQPASRNVWVL